MKETAREPASGLWAFSKGQLYTLPLDKENRKIDHVTWFQSLGLPDYGKDFDRIIRGRMVWDWRFGHFVLSFYGSSHLPNQVYEMVNRHFNQDGATVVEKPIAKNWL